MIRVCFRDSARDCRHHAGIPHRDRTMKPSRVATFDKQIAVLNAAVQRLTNERELAALALIEAPGSKEPLASMHNADEQLTKAKRELEHLQAARNAAARIDAVDDRAARLAELRSMRDAALKIAKKDRVALAAQLEALIGRAKPLLDKWATITAECRTLSSCIGVEAMGATEWVRRSDNVMDAATSEIGPGEALGGALVAAGLGITGPRCDAMRNIGHASRASARTRRCASSPSAGCIASGHRSRRSSSPSLRCRRRTDP